VLFPEACKPTKITSSTRASSVASSPTGRCEVS
jgi:hypothetical protein